MNKFRHIIISGLLLTIGAMIYILFREPVIFTMPFISAPESCPLIELPDNVWSDVVRYSLPDGLWCGALMTYVSAVGNRFMRLIAITMPFALEFGQLAGYVPGTFDIADLFVYTIITIIFLLKWKRKNSKCFATA